MLKNIKKLVPDVLYVKIQYKKYMGKKLNLKNPRLFNEKLQWLKIYNRNPIYTSMVDKYLVKDLIKEKIGEEYVIPTLGVWDDANKIDFDSLPNQFVLKCTHDSGGVIVCKDKKTLDIETIRIRLNDALKVNYYYQWREWPYKNVKPMIIAEQFIDNNGHVPIDYKIPCFNGKPYKIMVCVDRDKPSPTKFYSYDWEWNLLKHNKWGMEAKENNVCEKPSKLMEMYEIARTLSKDIPFVRVDLYENQGKIYFGELTFFPESGYDKNLNIEIDEMYGEMLKIE